MSALGEIVTELCAGFGLRAHDLPGGRHTALSITDLGELHLEEEDEELLVYLARDIEVGADRLALLRAALAAVHFHNALPFAVQAALHRDALVYLTRFRAHQVTLQELEHALEVLSGLQDKARV